MRYRPPARRSALVAAVFLLAACGGSSKTTSSTTTTGPTAVTTAATTDGAVQLPVVTGGFGTKPQIAAGKGAPPSGLKVSALAPGGGAPVADGDQVYVNYLGQLWDGKVFDNSFDRGQAYSFDVGRHGVIAGWDEGIVGQAVGSRVLLVVPPDKGYGGAGAGSAIPPNATLVFVVDILGAFNAKSTATGAAVALDDPTLPKVTADAAGKPTIEVPAGTAPGQLVSKVLIQGDGEAVKAGQTLEVQYTGVLWGSGKTFDSSWDHGSPVNFPIGNGNVIAGWDEALVGQKIGSRVLVVVPPDKGYGSKGNPRAGISGTDTLVFVVDLLGAF